jgi:hypothetical protein
MTHDCDLPLCLATPLTVCSHAVPPAGCTTRFLFKHTLLVPHHPAEHHCAVPILIGNSTDTAAGCTMRFLFNVATAGSPVWSCWPLRCGAHSLITRRLACSFLLTVLSGSYQCYCSWLTCMVLLASEMRCTFIDNTQASLFIPADCAIRFLSMLLQLAHLYGLVGL